MIDNLRTENRITYAEYSFLWDCIGEVLNYPIHADCMEAKVLAVVKMLDDATGTVKSTFLDGIFNEEFLNKGE